MSFPQPQYPTSAIIALLNAYRGWQAFEQTSAQTTLSPHNVPYHADHAHNPAPPSAALAFIQSCPYIDLADIPEHDRKCPVCYDSYHPLTELGKTPQEKVEENIIFVQRMPCGHYLCNRCLYKWLDPLDQRNNNTCPYDRSALFPRFQPLPGARGVQQRVDLTDWIYSVRGQPLAGEERRKTSRLKARLVECRLREAIRESEVDVRLMHFRITNARAIDNAALFDYNQELLHFKHRLFTIEKIARSLEENVPVSTFRVRLQHLVQNLARVNGTFMSYGAP
ncbi:hypothetical protein BDR22DRAFT_891362 [Usnea florida]